MIVRNLDPANTDTPVRPVRLVAFDSQGGRAEEVVLVITSVPLLPEIESPAPLLVVAGQTQSVAMRLVDFVEVPSAEVQWTATEVTISGVSVELNDMADGSVEVAVTAIDVPAGTEFNLELIATDEHEQQQTVQLPVTVVAAEARPRLSLSVKAGDAVVSSLIVTDTHTLSVDVALEGATNLATFTVTLNITEIDPSDGSVVGTALQQVSLLVVASGTLSIPVTGLTTTLDLVASDLVELTLTPSEDTVEGTQLRLQVAADDATLAELTDSDNDGLPDAHPMADDEEADLGPISAALASTTDAELRPDLVLSLGNRARSVGLGGCGEVSLELVLDTGALVDSLMGCEGLNFAEFPSSDEIQTALTAGDFAAGDDYLLFDLRATFDSVAAGEDELVLISLPAHPETDMFYRVYRFDGTDFVPALNGGLPAAASAPGVLAQVDNCETCLYAVDSDRDGSVELLLLLESVAHEAEAFSSVYQTQVAALSAVVADQTPTLTIPLAELFGTDLLLGITPDVLVTQADGGDNVSGELGQTESGEPALTLTGLRHTPGGAREVQVQLLDGTTPVVSVGAVISLQVRVPNRPPVVTFLLNGAVTDTLKLAPATTDTIVMVRIVDPDGGLGFFSLELIEGDSNIARPVSRAVRRTVDGAAVNVVEHRLVLNSNAPRASFNVRLRVTDTTNRSVSESGALMVCFVNEAGVCPSAPRGGGGGGGGGGATGLLWLLFAAPAVVLRRRRRV